MLVGLNISPKISSGFLNSLFISFRIAVPITLCSTGEVYYKRISIFDNAMDGNILRNLRPTTDHIAVPCNLDWRHPLPR